MGARESLNGRKNKARTKVKNGEKSPWDNVLPDQFQTLAAVLASDWCQKICVFPKKASALAGLWRTGPFRIIKVLFWGELKRNKWTIHLRISISISKQPRSRGSLLFVVRSLQDQLERRGTSSGEPWKRSWEPTRKFKTGLLKVSFAIRLRGCSYRSCDTQLSCISSTSSFLLLIISIIRSFW